MILANSKVIRIYISKGLRTKYKTVTMLYLNWLEVDAHDEPEEIQGCWCEQKVLDMFQAHKGDEPADCFKYNT